MGRVKGLTIVLPYFNNRGMLLEQQRVWNDYPDYVRDRLHVVVVDDCSDGNNAISPDMVVCHSLASLRLYRITEKKRWNWLACRNLGARVATTRWMILTDIDHVVPSRTLTAILDGDFRSDDAYKFKRVTATKPWPYDIAQLPEYKPHNDTWLLSRDLFYYDKGGRFVCGYDERLSGCYGTSGEFSDRVRQCARAIVSMTDIVIRYPREVIADASTSPTVYTRKGDPVNDEALREMKLARSEIHGWRPLHGLVPHELVYASDGAVA